MDKTQKFLKDLDENIKPISWYYDISSKIKDFSEKEKETSNEIKYEKIIFDLVEDYSWDDSQDEFFNWWTYYWPLFILPSPEDNTKMRVYPHINNIDQNIIDYFLKRADESVNPLLIARYVSVSYDFSNKLWLKKIDFKYIIKYINSVIEIYKNWLLDWFKLIQELQRAVFFIKMYKREKDFNKLKEIIVEYEKKQDTSKLWLWWHAFNLFVKDNKWIQIQEIEKTNIIDDIISRLETEWNKEMPNVYIIDKTLPVLKYIKDKYVDKFKKIFNQIVIIYNKNIEKVEDWLLKVNYLKWLLNLYEEYGYTEKVNETIWEIDKIDLRKNLQTFSLKHEITKEQIDSLIMGFFWENNSNDLSIIVNIIALHFIFSRNNAKESFEESQKNFPLLTLFSTSIIDNDWGLAWSLSWFDDLEKNLMRQASESIAFWNIFLDIIFTHFIKNIDKELFYNLLINSDIIKWESELEIRELVNNFYDGKVYALAGILIPLIESLFRKIIKLNWWVIKVEDKRNWWLMYKPLWAILNDTILTDLFTEDIMFYFKVVLSERLWLNLRNDFCHWIDREKFFNSKIVFRILHIFIILVSVIKIKE